MPNRSSIGLGQLVSSGRSLGTDTSASNPNNQDNLDNLDSLATRKDNDFEVNVLCV